MNDDYRISHRAPGFEEDGTTVRLDQVGGPHDEAFPRDVLEHPRRYGATHDEAIRQVRAAARSADPDRLVTIYRAVPRGVEQINPGDRVALSRDYAVGESARASTDGSADGHVITARTPARTLYCEGYLEEWAYQGNGPLMDAPEPTERALLRASFPHIAREAVTAAPAPTAQRSTAPAPHRDLSSEVSR